MTSRAELVLGLDRAYRLGTGTPTLGADGKDCRADFVHAPFSENLSTPSAIHARGPRLSSLRKIARALTPRGREMNESFNPQVAAEKARDTYRMTAAQFENLTLDNPVSEAMRALAEKNVAQTREVYEHSKDALEVTLETLERSFDSMGQGAIALNHKVIEIAQRNIDSGLGLAKSLAAAKNLAEVIELQAAHWRKQLGALADQAEEVRTLSIQVTVDSAKPIKEQVTRGVDELRKAA